MAYLSPTKSIYTSEDVKTLVLALVTSDWPDLPIAIYAAALEGEAKSHWFPCLPGVSRLTPALKNPH